MDETRGQETQPRDQGHLRVSPETPGDPSLAENRPGERHRRERIGRVVGLVVFLCTLVIVLITLYVATLNPGTHDAAVGADYIGLSPQVSGRVTDLHVGESSCVQKGTLLVQIDSHDYEERLRSAESDQQDLEAQIRDRKRQIIAGNDQAASSNDKLRNSRIDVAESDDKVASSKADVRKAQAGVDQAKATYELSQLTVERNRPLAEREYISRQKFDQYLTERDSNADALKQKEESLRSEELMESTSKENRQEALVKVNESFLDYRHDQWSVPTLDTLIAQRPSRASEVEQARVNLERTRIYAPINGCVAALSISRGAYAKEGSALFTLIDNDSWYITAAYRESDLRYIRPGMKAVVYLMSDPHYALDGTVQSIGNAVESSDSSSVGGSPGTPGSLPVIERSENWVRLASRYPVRIRFKPRDPSTLRIGTTANVTIVR